jgi:putative acetyltransferase
MPEIFFRGNAQHKAVIKVMDIAHYDEVIELWQRSEGIGLSDADSRDNIGRYLARNPGLSLVAMADGMIIGAMLCGHDGRRGYIHHLAVANGYRRRELGRQMVVRSLQQLHKEGIQKCHLFVFKHNSDAIEFWRRVGFTERVDLSMMSKLIDQDD